jgi:hypothetical protein
MTKVFLASFLFLSLFSKAQFGSGNESSTSLQLHAAYTHDFPGLNGYTVSGEVIHDMTDYLKAGLAVKRVNLNGYPRSETAREFTKATTIDLNAYLVPFNNDIHVITIGVGYAFSFYKIQRSYPLSQPDKTITWPIANEKGQVRGLSLIFSYEYRIPESAISLGLRGSMFRAYDAVTAIGPFVGLRL